jgi:hypothetical protein
VSRYQHPNWTAGAGGATEYGDGYWFWEKAVGYAKTLVN